MEAQIQALEGLIRSERGNLVRADQTQKSDHLKRNDRQWQVKLEAINRTAEDQLEERSKTLRWFSVGICKYMPGYKSHDLL